MTLYKFLYNYSSMECIRFILIYTLHMYLCLHYANSKHFKSLCFHANLPFHTKNFFFFSICDFLKNIDFIRTDQSFPFSLITFHSVHKKWMLFTMTLLFLHCFICDFHRTGRWFFFFYTHILPLWQLTRIFFIRSINKLYSGRKK